MRVKRQKIRKSVMTALGILVVSVLVFMYLLQRYWAHRKEYFVPDYEKVALSEESDYETFFLQTGLGRPAIDELLAEGDFKTVLDAQENFFQLRDVSCTPLLGWFTREDRVVSNTDMISRFVELQPGDIILTLSTHSLGWRHGHAALVLDEDTTLESMTLGTDATYGNVENWSSYSDYAVLRVRDVTPELQQQVAEYGRDVLYGVPYHLTAGLFGNKAPKADSSQFGTQCAYLVWYAWNHFGYDLDSDGGRLVTARDLLHSELLEVVQIYGMDPREF